MVTVGVLARLEAKPGKEEEVATFLAGALPLAEQERATTAWFANPDRPLHVRNLRCLPR
jgi:hypothetical protein